MNDNYIDFERLKSVIRQHNDMLPGTYISRSIDDYRWLRNGTYKQHIEQLQTAIENDIKESSFSEIRGKHNFENIFCTPFEVENKLYILMYNNVTDDDVIYMFELKLICISNIVANEDDWYEWGIQMELDNE